jgi:hypothetical protein
MSSGPTPAPPWRDTAPTPAAPGAPWRAAAPRAPYRTRWWKLAALATGGLLALAAVTWIVIWIRPPDPAQLLVLSANYETTLAVPPNPYGKATARGLTDLAKPGGWLGDRSRLNGPTAPAKLTRSGLTDLFPARGKCVVVVLTAHGGRDRDGAFLFVEDAAADSAARVRVKTLVEQLAKLPAKQQKLLILDATEPVAYPDLGLVHNDFASAVEDLNQQIAEVPNLAVFMSTGPDQRSWVSPEWGQTAFGYHLLRGLRGAADANGDKRITAGELVNFVRPRVHDWARDHRAALQTPVLLPKGAEGEARVAAMHLAMTDGPPPDDDAPTPFEPPQELQTAWAEYKALATAYVPPTAYTPHLWRQYEAWTLRYEQHIIAGDDAGAKHARAKASELKRQIEAARRLDISPQSLTIQSAVGGLPWEAKVPDVFAARIEQVARAPDEWAKVRSVPGYDAEATRVLWCRALVEWVAGDPLPRLPKVPALVPLVTEGMPVRPAEINFLLMLSRNLPRVDKSDEAGRVLGIVLRRRMDAEQAFCGVVSYRAYPFAEYSPLRHAAFDENRRTAEDSCFVGTENGWHLVGYNAGRTWQAYTDELGNAEFTATVHLPLWHWGNAQLPGFGEWAARGNLFARYRELLGEVFEVAPPLKPLIRDHYDGTMWKALGELGKGRGELDTRLTEATNLLLQTKPEFDARPTPRADAVRWWRDAESLLTAPPADAIAPARRAELVREFRRVSRQLLVTGKTRPDPLPEVTPEKTREVAFEAAQRRGQLLVARLGGAESIRRGTEDVQRLLAARPGEGFDALNLRLDRFAFQADGRQSLAELGSRFGELLDAVPTLATKADTPAGADRWIRLAPAHAAVTDAPIDRLRRERVRDFLVAQARRTYLDHWYGDGNTRYYRTAIEHLASDARNLGLPAQPGKPDPFAQYLGAETAFPVVPSAPPRFAVTDEPNPELKIGFTRQPPPGIDGFPVFWASPAFPPAKPEPDTRVPVPTDPKAELPALARRIVPPAGVQPAFPVAESGNVRITGFFRGRTLTSDVPVDVYRLPDRVAVTTPGLASTAIALRADPRVRGKFGQGSGAIAFVLDCSGSLGPPDPKDPKDRGLYPEAVKSLDALLRKLPPGTTITVSVFGHKTPDAKTAEETIREVLPPTALPFDTSSVIAKVDAAVANLEPWENSPIARAVLKAKDGIKDQPVPFKAVVLISDAVDNRWADDPVNTNPKRSVRDELRAAFPAAGVSLSVVAFKVPPEHTATQAEFKEVAKLDPAGLYVPPEKLDELAAWLRKGLNPRVYFSLDDGRDGGADLAAGSDLADNWYASRLEPGRYQLRVGGAKGYARTVELRRGDRLLLDLAEDGAGVALARHWWADTAPGTKSGKPADAWRFNLLQNRSEGAGLRLFAAIEERPKLTDVVAVSRVGDVWFELRPVVPKPEPVAGRWRFAPGYPAPAWSVDVPGWPPFPGSKSAASPVVEAWWSPEKPFSAIGTWTLPAKESLLSDSRRAVKVGDIALSLESVTVEEHAVEVSPDGKRESRKCLVVRLAHAAGSPLWVRPVGATPLGSEVRVYRAANRVTCVFWGIDPAKVTGFEVVSLNDSLKRAQELGHHAKLDNVPGPTDTAPRPEPPVKPR